MNTVGNITIEQFTFKYPKVYTEQYKAYNICEFATFSCVHWHWCLGSGVRHAKGVVGGQQVRGQTSTGGMRVLHVIYMRYISHLTFSRLPFF